MHCYTLLCPLVRLLCWKVTVFYGKITFCPFVWQTYLLQHELYTLAALGSLHLSVLNYKTGLTPFEAHMLEMALKNEIQRHRRPPHRPAAHVCTLLPPSMATTVCTFSVLMPVPMPQGDTRPGVLQEEGGGGSGEGGGIGEGGAAPAVRV